MPRRKSRTVCSRSRSASSASPSRRRVAGSFGPPDRLEYGTECLSSRTGSCSGPVLACLSSIALRPRSLPAADLLVGAQPGQIRAGDEECSASPELINPRIWRDKLASRPDDPFCHDSARLGIQYSTMDSSLPDGPAAAACAGGIHRGRRCSSARDATAGRHRNQDLGRDRLRVSATPTCGAAPPHVACRRMLGTGGWGFAKGFATAALHRESFWRTRR